MYRPTTRLTSKRSHGFRLAPVALLAAIFWFTSGFIAGQESRAQEDVQRIAAIVNNEMISEYDVVQRLRMMLASSGVGTMEEVRKRFWRQMLDALIDELLQTQEADKFDLRLEQEDIDNSYEAISRQNKRDPAEMDQFLIDNKIEKRSLIQKIRAELLWQRMVRGRFQHQISVGDDDVTEELNRLLSRKGEPEYLVYEIFLTVASPTEESRVRQSAQRISEQLRKGAPFRQVARQLSQGPTAVNGGVIGWVTPDQLPPNVGAVLPSLKKDVASDPVRAAGGFYIILLKHSRRVMLPDPAAAFLEMKQILLTVDEEMSEAEKAAIAQQAQAIAAAQLSCDMAEAQAKQIGQTLPVDIGKIRLGDMPDNFYAALEDVQIGQSSRALLSDRGYHIFIVCNRTEPEVREPDEDRIYYMLTERRADMVARRYMRDLRRDALIEIR